MKIPNRPEEESDDMPEPDADEYYPDRHEDANDENDDNPARLRSGAWLSLGLSLAFYLLMLAIGAVYDGDHHVRGKAAESGRSALPGQMASAAALTDAGASASSADAPGALLARARTCAAAAQWDCVIEATSGAIAQRGDTAEARTLLAQAMVYGGWVPRTAPMSSATGKMRDIRPVSTTPAEVPRATRHFRRHSVRSTAVRFTTMTHPYSKAEMEDLYRH